jgi:CheY-like chemotaxis protein
VTTVIADQAALPRVLIVDDDADIRASLAELLRLSGYEVEQADNGMAALERIASDSRPCVILLDLMMPVMNGWQFLELLRRREDPALASLPVVVLTALGLNTDELSRRFGCDVIGKPVDIDQLLTLARRYCCAS